MYFNRRKSGFIYAKSKTIPKGSPKRSLRQLLRVWCAPAESANGQSDE
jgi:hypothetical protein